MTRLRVRPLYTFIYIRNRHTLSLSSHPFQCTVVSPSGKRLQKYTLFPKPPNIFSHFCLYFSLSADNQHRSNETFFTARRPGMGADRGDPEGIPPFLRPHRGVSAEKRPVFDITRYKTVHYTQTHPPPLHNPAPRTPRGPSRYPQGIP